MFYKKICLENLGVALYYHNNKFTLGGYLFCGGSGPSPHHMKHCVDRAF